MVSEHQPLVRLVCLALLAIGLVSGLAVQSATVPSDGDDLPPDIIQDVWADSGQDSVDADTGEDDLTDPPAPAVVVDALPSALLRVCRVTAYCDRGVTASGRRVGVGQCAAPSYIPFGSKVYIPALKRTFVVTDRTHPRFRHNTVDIFIPSQEQSLRFGRRYLECEFTVPARLNNG